MASLGNTKAALNDYSEAIRLLPDMSAAYNNRGSLYIKQQKYDKAIKDFIKAIKTNPSYGTAYANRGIAYEYTGDMVSACSDWKTAGDLGIDYAKQWLNKQCKN